MQAASIGQTRLVTLDVLRGFAVMGILAMNIIAFAMPEWAYVTPIAYGSETMADRIAWLFSFVFVDGKMRGLFSLLFGASMVLIIERAQDKGENAAKVHYSRMVWLALFGLAHYFFIWFGDILFLYASVGCIAFLFRNWAPQRLIKWAFIIFGVGLLLWGIQLGGLQVMQYFANIPGADPELTKQYQEIKSNPEFNFDIANQLALHRGGYGGIIAEKLADWSAPLGLVLMSAAETLPLMMLGMAMMKNGFLTGEWQRAEYAAWAKKMLVPAIVLTAAVAAALIYAKHDAIDSLAAMFFWGNIPRQMMTIGYAAVLIPIAIHFSQSSFIARVAAVGQAAFTNYLGTSIVMTTIFYGYGLGLYGSVGRAQLWLFVFGAWAVMLLWSKPWLARFHYGPLEYLWRSLARMKLQPFAR